MFQFFPDLNNAVCCQHRSLPALAFLACRLDQGVQEYYLTCYWPDCFDSRYSIVLHLWQAKAQ